MNEPIYSSQSLVRDLLQFLQPYKARFWFATSLRVASDLANLYPPFAFAAIVSFFALYKPNESLDPVWVLLLFSGLSLLFNHLTAYYARTVMFAVSEQVALDAQLKTIDHMFRLPAHWHEKENTGNKLKRIDRGSYGFDKVLRIWINHIIEIFISLVGIIIIIATIDTLIALSLFIFIVVFFFISRSFIVRAGKASEVVNIAEENVSGLLYESLNNIRTVQVLNMPLAIVKLLSTQTQVLYQKILKRIFWFQTGTSVRSFSGHLYQLSILAFIAWGISQGQYEVGFLVLFSTYFNRIWQSVQTLSEITQDLVVARYSVGRLMQILKTPARSQDESHLLPMINAWKTISFEEVSFSYDGAKILKDISFTVRRGEKVGLVGLSGAGKSTLFKLLLREHKPSNGTIKVDGTPLEEIRRGDYFEHISTVLQDTEVFNMSIIQNITLANESEIKNKNLLHKALKVSHVDDFIEKLPQGSKTQIGEKGIKLSGGERQRLGIARAVFKDPTLLLLDEATSNLDVESEIKIKDSLHELFQSVTAVVIAHRLSTIKEMDRIIVLENGRIIEEGSFDGLLKQRGRFFELWEKQRLN